VAGNSQRQGAKRTPGSKKGSTTGSGGQRRKALTGRGPTPRAEERTGHTASRRSGSAAKTDRSGSTGGQGARGGGARSGAGRGTGGGAGRRRSTGSDNSARGGPRGKSGRGAKGSTETVAGRNAVVEALRAGVPATALQVAARIDTDDRVREALMLATGGGIPLLETTRNDLDRLTDGAVHQGLVLQVPAYSYADPADLVVRAQDAGRQPLIVALDGVTDPRNVGAIVRSVAAFGGHGVVVPDRRSAGMTASAWKTSAGAAARIPVARATNLTRALVAYQQAGLFVVGLDADGDLPVDALEIAAGPLVLVVGSEGKGLSRLVRETCDLVASIPMSVATESLNAGVAAGVALYEVARKRRTS
jgi:23S rRNA (guanosine2251-2'-O)-methyltransferase